MTRPLQPFLHDLTTVLAAPTQALSAQDGDVVSGPPERGAQGIYHGDVRVLSDVAVRVDGERPEHIATDRSPELGSGRVRFVSVLRHVRTDLATHPDPTLRLDRVRTVAPGEVAETLTLSSVLDEPVELQLSVVLASDLAPMQAIKGGAPVRRQPFGPPTSAATGRGPGARLDWAADTVELSLTAPGATAELSIDRTEATLRWSVTVPAHDVVDLGWALLVTETGGVIAAAETPGLAVPELTADLVARALPAGTVDPRVAVWARQSLSDLNGLRMTLRGRRDPFFAAGSPWYFTLFGRDSLWAARLLLPIDLSHAAGTLRTLAALQGTKVDPGTAESPGKIMHELRSGEYAFSEISLPPLYFGTIDATALWICLLHDAWRAGLDDATVVELLPSLEAALVWLVEYGDADGDGFLEYVDESGHGLTNQGWKDSGDSVRFADGRIAEGPVALCEVQGYAYEAAVGGAALLEAFGSDPDAGARATTYRSWAAELAARFRAAFWVERDGRRFPALALDGAKRQVDSTTSNIGHLLGTGLLDAAEEELVATRLAEPDLDSGLGLRTMSALDGGYSPLSYHCGSVWPHDTAIVVAGMVRSGHAEQARGLVDGLLRASTIFDQRFPELWSGEGVAGVPYPASCRPQAWSAASVVPVAAAMAALIG